ncbi:EF-hand domain-containing protein [Paraneptunicella aestuarii]|uniref:EF-hand domain-containing protein n=1 Tax=Paraneptunicella aestuarii TaxID=2831148 RepID=UPI001E2C32F7|nr:EF-hand domain-containing protein [Paraneptunicella aestuarii]UAA40467.1 EF-hand domain-containing protein [Paraneptunicella aestuarii]
MTAISGFGGMSPQDMMQNMQERIKSADTDGNGSVSMTELKELSTPDGEQVEGHPPPPPDLDKMFSNADTDGDGELSQEEQEAMFAEMEERMSQFNPGNAPPSTGYETSNTGSFQSLFETLKNNTEDESEKEEFQEMLDKLKENNSEQGQLASIQRFNEMLPPIDVLA